MKENRCHDRDPGSKNQSGHAPLKTVNLRIRRLKSQVDLLFKSIEPPVDAIQTIANLAVGTLQACYARFPRLDAHCRECTTYLQDRKGVGRVVRQLLIFS
jgi:hypothetical protein